MGRIGRSLPAAIGLLLALSVSAPAQKAAAGGSGGDLFFTYCGACHGKGGEGDGPAAGELEYTPPDLTRIARRNDGEFPRERVFRIVDGRNPVEGHGGPEMPRWGDVFRTREDDFDEQQAERSIALIVDYIASIQKEE